MNDSITETIAATLGAHRLEQGMRIGKGESVEWWECLECGWNSGEFDYRDVAVELEKRRHQSDAVLAALKAARIALIELPGQTIIPTGWDGDCIGAWPVSEPGYVDPVSAWPNGEIALPNGDFIAASKARALAAAMLAACDAAESVTR